MRFKKRIDYKRGSYIYRAINHSYLHPHIFRFYYSRISNALPNSVSANSLTLLGNVFMLFGFSSLFLTNYFAKEHAALIFAVCLHLYILFDCLDGVQARRTDTASPLGEFMDHHLDVYSSSLIVIGFIYLFVNLPQTLCLIILSIYHINMSLLFLVQKREKIIHFPAFGPWESSLVLYVFLYLGFSSSFSFFPMKFDGETSEHLFFFRVTLFIFIVIYFFTLLKHKAYSVQNLLFSFVCFFLVTVLNSLGVSFVQAALVITLYSGNYSSKIIYCHLTDHLEPWPDLWFPATVLLLFLLTLSGILSYSFFFLMALLLIIVCAGEQKFLFELSVMSRNLDKSVSDTSTIN